MPSWAPYSFSHVRRDQIVRRLIILPVTLLTLLLAPGEAFAHAVGQSQDLPVPFWLYLFGAAAVVVISFVQIGLFVGENHTLQRCPRFNLLAVIRLTRMQCLLQGAA